ncbi:hypothetical protein EW145_g773 [Phellinidium pouzarii]|uniref:Translation initiation factor 3 N-terminal domain-containing protein n=1 Tax=Phellinidium pouzarii TaxID=167371 RepID=A0A4S4LMM2_9AGAM|nr:hypothetical protein EW145_g773 [Phellinidium pouzarii]
MLAKHSTRLLRLSDAFGLQPSTPTNTFRTFSSSIAILSYKNSRQKITIPTPDRKPKNEEINKMFVQRVEPETNKLLPPERLAHLLVSIDRKTHFIELVQDDPPVVKIINKKEAHAFRKAYQAKKKEQKKEQKEVQMTWNVGAMDLVHKLQKARKHLERGNMVDIAFAPKAKQELPSRKEMLEKMQHVLDTLNDVAREKHQQTLERNVGVVSLRPQKSKSSMEDESLMAGEKEPPVENEGS